MSIQDHINAFIGESPQRPLSEAESESAIRALINDKLKRAEMLRGIASGDTFDDTTREKLMKFIDSEHKAHKQLQKLLGGEY